MNSRPSVDLHQQMTQLSACLAAYRALWQVKAFDCDELPWQAQFPMLADSVWQVADSEIDALDADQSLLVERFLPVIAQDMQLSDLESQQLQSLLTDVIDNSVQVQAGVNDKQLPEAIKSHFSAHIKGRKWQQIERFSNYITPQTPILEWCAGKGHLGRYLAKLHDTPVHSVEWQQALCDEGQAFAQRWQLPQQFQCADVFNIANKDHQATSAGGEAAITVAISTPVTTSKAIATSTPKTIASPLRQEQYAVALHACGDLHVKLLNLATQAQTQSIAISPCCYHLIQTPQYQALSSVAKQASFSLSRHDLQLPLQQSVIASDSQKQLRLKEIAWRLGFDCLQRQQRNINEYLPIPSIKRSQLSGQFANFCQWAANAKQLTLTEDIDFDYYLKLGTERQRLTQRIDLIAHLFRRALEKWLVIDRACYLVENNYQVEVFEFCVSSITPRNCLIRAHKAN
ncbi:methyltransferase [Shewanella maritima]|uniref:methyltransferase n=1 Tax=Shewanella maritima TaxID=2520507 RepID=UPI003735BAE0